MRRQVSCAGCAMGGGQPRKNAAAPAALECLRVLVSGAALFIRLTTIPPVSHAHETIPARDVLQHACAGRGPGSRDVDRPGRSARSARAACERTIRSWSCIFGSRCDIATAWKSVSETAKTSDGSAKDVFSARSLRAAAGQARCEVGDSLSPAADCLFLKYYLCGRRAPLTRSMEGYDALWPILAAAACVQFNPDSWNYS